MQWEKKYETGLLLCVEKFLMYGQVSSAALRHAMMQIKHHY
jgi:hypothetical protein